MHRFMLAVLVLGVVNVANPISVDEDADIEREFRDLEQELQRRAQHELTDADFGEDLDAEKRTVDIEKMLDEARHELTKRDESGGRHGIQDDDTGSSQTDGQLEQMLDELHEIQGRSVDGSGDGEPRKPCNDQTTKQPVVRRRRSAHEADVEHEVRAQLASKRTLLSEVRIEPEEEANLSRKRTVTEVRMLPKVVEVYDEKVSASIDVEIGDKSEGEKLEGDSDTISVVDDNGNKSEIESDEINVEEPDENKSETESDEVHADETETENETNSDSDEIKVDEPDESKEDEIDSDEISIDKSDDGKDGETDSDEISIYKTDDKDGEMDSDEINVDEHGEGQEGEVDSDELNVDESEETRSNEVKVDGYKITAETDQTSTRNKGKAAQVALNIDHKDQKDSINVNIKGIPQKHEYILTGPRDALFPQTRESPSYFKSHGYVVIAIAIMGTIIVLTLLITMLYCVMRVHPRGSLVDQKASLVEPKA